MDVKGVSGNNREIKLSKLYAMTELLVDKEEIATSDIIKQWDYLKVMTSDITQTDSIKVDLLIGANCMRALELLTVISSVWWSLHLSNKARLVYCVSYYQYGW